jgi:hypothetical protein
MLFHVYNKCCLSDFSQLNKHKKYFRGNHPCEDFVRRNVNEYCDCKINIIKLEI